MAGGHIFPEKREGWICRGHILHPPVLESEIRSGLSDLVVLAREPRGVRRPEPEMQRHRLASSVLACDGHASVVAEVVAYGAFAVIPNL